jgi:hypothetical protein
MITGFTRTTESDYEVIPLLEAAVEARGGIRLDGLS